MCQICAKKVVDILDKIEKGGQFRGLSEDDKEQERMMLGMRIRSNMDCPCPEIEKKPNQD